MNATSATRADQDDGGGEDEDDEDEDGEAADMEGSVSASRPPARPSAGWQPRGPGWTSLCPFRVRGKRPAGNGRGRRSSRSNGVRGRRVFPVHAACGRRRPWTPAGWPTAKPEWSVGAKTPFCRPGPTTCASPTINTTRPLDSGSSDTMR